MGNASGSDGGGVGSDRSSGIAGRSGARGAEAGNNQRGGFSGGAMGTPGSDRGGIRGNEGNTGRNSAMGRSAPSPNRSVPNVAPRATVTVAPPPVRIAAPPPVRVAPVPSAPPAAVAAPTASVPKGPSGMPSLDALAAQTTGQSLASIQGNTAPTAAAPSRSMSPATRGNIADAARAVGARSVGTPSSATPSRSASPSTRGGIADAARAVGAAARDGLPSVNRSAKGDFGGTASGRGLVGETLGNIGRGISDMVTGRATTSASKSQDRLGQSIGPLGPTRGVAPDTRALSDTFSAGLARTGLTGPLGALQTTGRSLDRMAATPAAPVGRAAVGVPSSLSGALSGPVATDPYSGLIDASRQTSMRNSRAVQDAVRDRIAPTEAQRDRLDAQSFDPNFGISMYGEVMDDVTATPTAATHNLYSADNSYEGAQFPSVVDAYPGVFGSIGTGSLPGGYSTTTQGAWSQTAPSFESPMEAARSMAPMDQLRAYNMFTRGGTPPAQGERGGSGETARQKVVKRIAEALKKEVKKSGWRPYDGPSRFANWSPIQKALMNG